eukprot:g26393.t1
MSEFPFMGRSSKFLFVPLGHPAHQEVDSDEEDAANVSPIKTEPVKSFAGSSAGQPAAENAKDAPIRPVTPKMDAREVPCLLRQSLCSDYGVKVTVKNTFIDVASDEEGPNPQEEEEEHDELSSRKVADDGVAASLVEVIVPLSIRQPEASVGSAHHGIQCKPCSWFWRPQGCFNSRDCAHCHMCLPGELRLVTHWRHIEVDMGDKLVAAQVEASGQDANQSVMEANAMALLAALQLPGEAESCRRFCHEALQTRHVGPVEQRQLYERLPWLMQRLHGWFSLSNPGLEEAILRTFHPQGPLSPLFAAMETRR